MAWWNDPLGVKSGYDFKVGDRVEVGAIGGSIPGIPPGRYWVVEIQIVSGSQQFRLSDTQGGPPLAVTGPIVGSPRVTTVRSQNPDLAFSQQKSWLQLEQDDVVLIDLNRWLTTELGDFSV